MLCTACQLSLLPSHLILCCLCPSPPAQIKRNLFWGVLRGIMKRLPWIPSLNRLHIQGAEQKMTDAIFHISEFPLSLSSAHKLMDRCVKNAKDQDPKNRPAGRRCGPHLRRCLLRAPRGGLYGIFRLILVFVVSPWRDDLYYLGCEIKGAFLTDLMKLASYKPRELVQIVQLLRFPAKCGREAKHCTEKNSSFCSCAAYRIHDPAV